MHRSKTILLLYLVVSTLALERPDTPVFSGYQNAGFHRIHKRDVEKIHSIDVQKAKEQLIEAYQEIKPLLEKLVADIAPSIHEKITQSYLPVIQSLQNEVMPFFNAKVYPQLQKYLKFGLSIAEKLIEKTYRAYKLSNSTHIAVVSVSDLIDEVFTELKPIIEMGKYLSARMMVKSNYRSKRDASQNLVEDDSEVHLIDIQKSKESLIKAYQAVKPLLENLLAEISPSIYEEFELNYFPKLQDLTNYIFPFVQSQLFPQVEKYFKFASSIVEKLVDRTYRSYHLSNSTHINIVSISDIIEEVYTEFRPILDLVKYLSARMSTGGKHYRGKRDLSEASEKTLIRQKRQVPGLLFTVISPVMEDVIDHVSTMFRTGSDSFFNGVLLPLIRDLMSDPESKYDLKSLFVLAHAAFSPLMLELVQTQTWNTPEGTVVKIPRQYFDEAVAQLRVESRPIVNKLMRKYMGTFLRYLHNASHHVIDLFDQLVFERYEGADVLKDQFFTFMNKHRGLFKKSTNSYVYYYTVNEIKNDFLPLAVSGAKVLVQFLRRNPTHWLNTLFGEYNSLLQDIANGKPVYAQPATPKYAKPVIPTKKATTRVIKYIKRA